MNETIAFFSSTPGTSASAAAFAAVELFDPPMCCPTGVCGPTIDRTLLDVNQRVLDLQATGVLVARYQMTSHPNVFANNSDAKRLVREQ